MKEIVFLQQNAEKWKQYEQDLKNRKKIHPDKLAELYIELTNDLSYAATNYPGSKTTGYLHSLSSRIHQAIYINKKEDKKKLAHFWKIEFPDLLYKYRKNILYSFFIFLISAIIGIISSANNKNFVRLIMGDTYVKMTLENIESGDPMAVYKSMNSADMFLGVTLNNIMVSFYAFSMGVLGSIGTGFILFRNGVMLGAFHYFFHEHDLLYRALMSIWLHGTLEISSIIIAGAAGLVIGNSILFPGTYSRLVSFRRGAVEGLKIIIGLIPIFVIAGSIEGFVTRYTNMPVILNVFIIAVSLAIVLLYFIIFPAISHRRSVRIVE